MTKKASEQRQTPGGRAARPRAGLTSTLRRAALGALCVLAAAVPSGAQRRAGYTNPVAAGDFPDPTVIRVGRDYWATATTSEWGPEYPILHSRDLVNWEAVGVVFRKRPDWAGGSFWAPELAHDRGRFFLYYTARKKGGPLCVAVATAPRPQGPYTDRGPMVCQEVGSIDPFVAADERGRRFLFWKEDGNSVSKPTVIWAQRLSADGTRLVGERREVLRNDQAWEKHPTLPYGDLVEGPAVVRRGGWYYMFYSGNFCCARECNYAMGVARSRSLLGPWEKNPANPILAGNDAWRCPGHGTVVEDGRGRHWLLYHAYQQKDFVYVGRQALLDEVTWGADGWPAINGGRGPSAGAAAPSAARARGDARGFFDEFTSATLHPLWQWPGANVPGLRVEPARGGRLVLSPSNEADGDPAAAVIARPTTSGDYVATAVVDLRGMRGSETAGLSAYGDAENALGVSVDRGGGTVMWRREKGALIFNAVSGPANMQRRPLAVIHLRMTAREGHLYRFAASADGRAWQDLGGEVEGAYLPPWDRGVRVALVAGGARGAAGRFDSLRIEPSR
ncbi:MAG: family 43 glycosylhydrolase [Acidobacteria bacterium]|nr:family 43 glycosylhydrolase [Acidobacteriota bacterium]